MKLEYEFVRRIAKQIGLDIEKSKIFDIWKKNQILMVSRKKNKISA